MGIPLCNVIVVEESTPNRRPYWIGVVVAVPPAAMSA